MALLSVSYPELSVFVGAAQVADAIVLLRRRGQITKAIVYFSFFEYAWAVFSFFEVWNRFSATPEWLPISFIAWILMGVSVGLSQRSKHVGVSAPTIAPWLVIIGGLFGLYFFGASLWLSGRA